jgi:hypothetical protein
MQYIAAAPADYRSSFSGSGLPFASAEQAFYNTPNSGTADVDIDGAFAVRLYYPNSYYVGLGSGKVPPTLHMTYLMDGKERQHAARIGNGVPFRSLSYPRKRTGADFYEDDEQRPVMSQEAILRASAYPETNREPHNFWGDRPRR